MDLHTPVTVQVERDGEYRVSIFAISEGMGMLGPTGQCNAIVSAIDVTSAATTEGGVQSTSTQPQSEPSATVQNSRYFIYFLK